MKNNGKSSFFNKLMKNNGKSSFFYFNNRKI